MGFNHKSPSRNTWLDGLNSGDVERRKISKEHKKNLEEYKRNFKNLKFPKNMAVSKFPLNLFRI